MSKLILSLTFFLFVTNSYAQKPKAVFGNLTDEGPYDRSEILLQEELNITSSDDEIYEILSYTLSVPGHPDNPIRFDVLGSKLPVKLQGALNSIIEGDKIVIESIVALASSSDKTIKLNPVILEIKKYESNGAYTSAYKKKSNIAVQIDSLAYAQYGSIKNKGNPVSKEELLAQNKLVVLGVSDLKYKISSFKMIIAYKEKPPVMMSSSSERITSKMMELITNTSSGDRVLMEGIRATYQVDTEIYNLNLAPIVLKVK